MRGNNDNANIIQKIAAGNQLEVKSCRPLGGGDINEVYLLETAKDKFIIKLNDASRFPGMFEAEKEGLEELSAAGVIKVPEVKKVGEESGASYILMEYINSAKPPIDFSRKFGQQLAALHKTTAKDFGFKSNNYIGSLPQCNTSCTTAAEFYITQRLEPQIKMAKDKGNDLGDPSALYKNCEALIPQEPPALVHGDLWSGNYMVGNRGEPCLIDPAVSYAPREMDLGMMKLFGGFDKEIFETYEEHFPTEAGLEERIPLWQLYYLLVHLNIFGSGYRSQVSSILNRYS
ncbi:fructosamine kinase family protein [Antarcticibacterium flavum]|uniref:Fructosamine kinase family protein n=2 Tax=Flavobacteriaceae TaxID=49546 RepID=A0A5B7X9H1_9FLAO|nr:fructosamine kinase [Antarcticibacterium sp. W02-3]QCY71368.1 fructosamine kinase family protein [Antarcticibacterium flavum]